MLLLHRLFVIPSQQDSEPETQQRKAVGPDLDSLTGQGQHESLETSLAPVDASGGYLLQASIRVVDGSNPELMSRGTSELMGFKESLKGCLDLRAVERLALDTRIKQ